MRVFFGEEDFLVQRALWKFKREFIEKNPQALVEIFDGGENSVKDFLYSLSQGSGLFVQKKMVVLENVFDFDKDSQEKILKFLESDFNLKGGVELVIAWRGRAKKTKLFNFLSKEGQVAEFKKNTPLEAEKFILNKLEGVGKIEPRASRRLAMILSGNLWLLDRELEKLINFKAGKTITEKDVDEMCDGEVSVKIFDLVDAIGNKNKKRAYEILSSLLNQGEDGFYILSMMIFQIRNLALVLDCREKGISDSRVIAQKIGLHPYVAQKTLGQLGRFSVVQVKEIYQRAFSLDINSKSGKINIKEALEDFVIKI